MPLSETAKSIARYLGGEPRQRGCEEDAIRGDLGLTAQTYQAAIDELVDYGLVGPALTDGERPYGCLVLTELGRQAAGQDFAAEALPLTPTALARNPIAASGWAIESVVAGQNLPEERGALVSEIVRAVQGLLLLAGECLPAATLETVQAAAEALIGELRQEQPRLQVIRRALRVMALPDGTPNLSSPIVSALPALVGAIDTLTE